MAKPTHHVDFFDLRTPADLFRKIESDLAALERAPTDSHIAFNLFVTLEHLPDWLGRRDLVKADDEATRNSVLKIVSNVANGGKHFYVDRHRSVDSLGKSGWDDGWAPGWTTEELEVGLVSDEQKALRWKYPKIAAITLAHMALDFWRPYVVGYSGRSGSD